MEFPLLGRTLLASSAVLLLASTTANALESAPERDLAVLAAASPRPRVCTRSENVWERARFPARDVACRLLLRATVALPSRSSQALEWAREAGGVAVAAADAAALEARAHLALGDPEAARSAFARAGEDPFVLRAPSVRHALARSLVLTGDDPGALREYRNLVTRAAVLPGEQEATRMLIEASLVAQGADRDALLEARAYAVEARARASVALREISLATVALAASRLGRPEESAAMAKEAGGHWGLEWAFEHWPPAKGVVGEVLPVMQGRERLALIAVLAEPNDPDVAVEAWSEYVETFEGDDDESARLAHARQRIEALSR